MNKMGTERVSERVVKTKREREKETASERGY